MTLRFKFMTRPINHMVSALQGVRAHSRDVRARGHQVRPSRGRGAHRRPRGRQAPEQGGSDVDDRPAFEVDSRQQALDLLRTAGREETVAPQRFEEENRLLSPTSRPDGSARSTQPIRWRIVLLPFTQGHLPTCRRMPTPSSDRRPPLARSADRHRREQFSEHSPLDRSAVRACPGAHLQRDADARHPGPHRSPPSSRRKSRNTPGCSSAMCWKTRTLGRDADVGYSCGDGVAKGWNRVPPAAETGCSSCLFRCSAVSNSSLSAAEEIRSFEQSVHLLTVRTFLVRGVTPP